MTIFSSFAGWRTTPIAIFAVAILIVLGGIGIVIQSESSYISQRHAAAGTQTRVLAQSVSAAVDFNDMETAQQATNAFGANRAVRKIGIYDRNGRAVARYGRDDMFPATLGALPEANSQGIRGVGR